MALRAGSTTTPSHLATTLARVLFRKTLGWPQSAVKLTVGIYSTGNLRDGSKEDVRGLRPSGRFFSAGAGSETADGIGDGGDAGVRRRQIRQATRSCSAPAPAGDAPLRDGAAEVPVSSARWRRRPLPEAAAAAAVKNGAGVGEGRGGAGVLDVGARGFTWRMRRGQTWPWRRGPALAVAAGENLDRSGGDGDWWWRRGLSLAVAAGEKIGGGGRREALVVAAERGLSAAGGGALRRLLRAGAFPWPRGRKLVVAAVGGLEVASGGVLGGGGQRGHGG